MVPFELTATNIALVTVAFLVAGTSKGILGVGIPLIAVPALSGVMHPATTLSVLALPIALSNLWQALEGRRFRRTFSRFWPAIPTMIAGGLLGAQFITTIDPKTAQIALGIIVLAYASSQFLSVKIPAPPERLEKFWTAFVGFVSGLLGGFAAYFGPPVIMYLLALKATKEEFVSCAGMLYLIGIIPVFLTLVYKGVLGTPELTLSVLGTALIMTALFFGTWLRNRISQEIFRKALLVILVAMAFNMLRRGFEVSF
jgi:uncharacterized membrane protein YfcA